MANGNQMSFAGFWRRVLAAVIDTLLLWLPGSLFTFFLKSKLLSIGWSKVELAILDYIQLVIIWTLYYGFLESSKIQGTLGKRLIGIKVTDIHGQRISFSRAIARALLQYVAILPLGIGIFMVAFTKRKQGLHDMIAKCLVIKR